MVECISVIEQRVSTSIKSSSDC